MRRTRRNINEMESDVQKRELSVRASNRLREIGIFTLGDLVQLTESQLTRECGKKTVNELKVLLEELGLKIDMTMDDVMELYVRKLHGQIERAG